MKPADTDLIYKAQKGDIPSFEELILKYDKQVLSIALKYTGSHDDAKDIYQEVFLRVFRGLKNFKFKSEFSTWLFRITTNVCLTYKMRSKKYSFVSIDEEYEDDEREGLKINIEDENESPERYTLNSEISDNINAAMESLTPRQKMIFLLKHHEGYKLKEIAVLLDVGEGTVKKYLFEAVHKLRDQLKEVYG